MADIDYHSLNRQQKLALFLISIGPESATHILKQFSEEEVAKLCREMTTFDFVPQNVLSQVFQEFSDVIALSKTSAFGGMPFARKVVASSKGESRVNAILEGIGLEDEDNTDVIKQIGMMDTDQIFNLIKAEGPQTIAFVLSYLETKKSAIIFSRVAPELQDEVLERMGTIDPTNLEYLEKMIRLLGKHGSGKSKTKLNASGGVPSVASLLKLVGKENSKTFLSKIEERNKPFVDAVKKKMFGFEDLIKLQVKDMQRIMRDVDMAQMPMAMKNASPILRDKIYAAMSKRAAEGLKEEIELLGPAKMKDIEAAQDAIIETVRSLDEAGEVSLDNDSASLVA
jgi:flagellar motor switch protein FliG